MAVHLTTYAHGSLYYLLTAGFADFCHSKCQVIRRKNAE
jgi:hypothetical protein